MHIISIAYISKVLLPFFHTLKVEHIAGPESDGVTYQVTLSTDHVAMFVLLETDVEGIFSDNGFIMSEPTLAVQFVSREQTSAAELWGSIEVRSLTDTYDPDEAWKRYWTRKLRGY